jgi:hypothetical protein
MANPMYDADAHAWSGLFSGDKLSWQQGLRNVCAAVGDVMFHSSMSGYEGWEDVAESAIRRRPPSMFFMGHSNGGYAITAIARALEPYGIPCWLCSWDRTMKPCATIGGNVPEAIDIWAGLRTLKKNERFRGNYVLHDFSRETHIGLLGNEKAQQVAIEFGRRWKASRA